MYRIFRELTFGFLNLSYFSGGHMVEHNPQNWITIKDQETGIQADFPHQPLEMTFDVPFQNTPPKGKIHLYSFPTQSGILVLTIYSSETLNDDWLQKENLHHFFADLLAPHLFFDPLVFQNQQTFTFQPEQIDGEKGVSFQISYHDHGAIKKIEGIARMSVHTLYVYFYLASEKSFDQELFSRFLDSIAFSKDT
jgi:hypothetical protein